MPSFRNSKQQAQHVVKKHLAIKQAKHKAKLEGKIFSVGTARNYEQALSNVARWLKDNLAPQPKSKTKRRFVDG